MGVYVVRPGCMFSGRVPMGVCPLTPRVFCLHLNHHLHPDVVCGWAFQRWGSVPTLHSVSRGHVRGLRWPDVGRLLWTVRRWSLWLHRGAVHSSVLRALQRRIHVSRGLHLCHGLPVPRGQVCREWQPSLRRLPTRSLRQHPRARVLSLHGTLPSRAVRCSACPYLVCLLG
jgi:hypothetical protein